MPILMTRAAATGLFAALLLAPATMAQEGDYHAAILSRPDDTTLMVRTTVGDKKVILTPDTKIQVVEGALKVRRKNASASDLIRGLAIDVKGTGGGDEITATEITFRPGSLKTAKQIAAGTYDTNAAVAANAAGIAANAERIDNVGDFKAAGRTKVFFAVGSTALTSEGQEELKAIAEKAKATQGYRLAVVGRADPTGDAAANRRLSARRATAVKDYLIENCGILPGRIVPNTALGESSVANDPDPPKNNVEARRVTVTIMVSKSARDPAG